MSQRISITSKAGVQLSADDIVGSQGPGRLIHCLYRRMIGFAEAHFPGADLSFTHWLSLKLVHDGVVVTAGDLARETMMTTGATTRLVDALEERRLLSRNRLGADRRVVRLQVTTEGEARMLAMAPVLASAWTNLLTDFEVDEFGKLMRSLGKLTMAFSNYADRSANGGKKTRRGAPPAKGGTSGSDTTHRTSRASSTTEADRSKTMRLSAD